MSAKRRVLEAGVRTGACRCCFQKRRLNEAAVAADASRARRLRPSRALPQLHLPSFPVSIRPDDARLHTAGTRRLQTAGTIALSATSAGTYDSNPIAVASAADDSGFLQTALSKPPRGEQFRALSGRMRRGASDTTLTSYRQLSWLPRRSRFQSAD